MDYVMSSSGFIALPDIARRTLIAQERVTAAKYKLTTASLDSSRPCQVALAASPPSWEMAYTLPAPTHLLLSWLSGAAGLVFNPPRTTQRE
jgi:hypothetical protein